MDATFAETENPPHSSLAHLWRGKVIGTAIVDLDYHSPNFGRELDGRPSTNYRGTYLLDDLGFGAFGCEKVEQFLPC